MLAKYPRINANARPSQPLSAPHQLSSSLPQSVKHRPSPVKPGVKHAIYEGATIDRVVENQSDPHRTQTLLKIVERAHAQPTVSHLVALVGNRRVRGLPFSTMLFQTQRCMRKSTTLSPSALDSAAIPLLPISTCSALNRAAQCSSNQINAALSFISSSLSALTQAHVERANHTIICLSYRNPTETVLSAPGAQPRQTATKI